MSVSAPAHLLGHYMERILLSLSHQPFCCLVITCHSLILPWALSVSLFIVCLPPLEKLRGRAWPSTEPDMSRCSINTFQIAEGGREAGKKAGGCLSGRWACRGPETGCARGLPPQLPSHQTYSHTPTGHSSPWPVPRSAPFSPPALRPGPSTSQKG